MLLNKFSLNVSVRVLFLALSGVALGVIIQHLSHGYYYTLAGLIFLILVQTYLLINLVNKTNSDLDKFFSSVQNHDSSIRFSENSDNESFRKLHKRMNDLNTIIQNVKIENERTGLFLQSVVDHVDIGLISFDTDGRQGIYNLAAKKYSLNNRNEELFKIIKEIKPGQEILFKKKNDNSLQNILIKADELNFESKVIKLVSFQDITNELDKKELESWQRLIRVLTHEIMNSISPIISLTTMISGYFNKKNDINFNDLKNTDNQIVAKTLSGLDTIEETGKGLLEFVGKYRSLTSLPKPSLCSISVDSLFRKSKLLMESDIPGNIKIITAVYPEDLTITADFAQIEQILINLIKNAVEALSGRKSGTILLKGFRSVDGTIIQVEDNGTGIPADILENIFVPFYTTRENGSGIGLSLSKQIMQNHDGSISVDSVTEKGSKFILKFA